MTSRHLIIARGERLEMVIRKSRFISSIARVDTQANARDFADLIRTEFWDANHNCVAWTVGVNGRFQRSNDDGEPSGTAGTPMLEVLRKRGLTDTVVVVTRYFGGVKLGAGGLIRAYGQSVSAIIDAVGTVERRALSQVSVIGHNDAGRIEHALRTTSCPPDDVGYDGAGVTFRIMVDPGRITEFNRWVAGMTSGKATVTIGKDVFVDVPVQPHPGLGADIRRRRANDE